MISDKELDELNKKIKGYDITKEQEDEYINNNPDSERLTTILSIQRREKFDVADDKTGIELNEGYSYDVNGAIPEIADGIAKMGIVMNDMKDLGENAGEMFIQLIYDFYNKLKEVKHEAN